MNGRDEGRQDGRDGASAPAPAREGPFVGRESELRRLEELLEAAKAGRGGAALITGDAGIGKSALAREFIRRARLRDPSLTLCRGRCLEQYGTSEVYLPFLDALGSLLQGRGREETAALLRTFAPTWCLHLPALWAGAEGQEAARQQAIGATQDRMLREMGDVFDAAAASALLIGLLEDIQWADRPSIELVRHLVKRMGRQRRLVVLTLRPAELEGAFSQLKGLVLDLRVHENVHEIALGPLLEPQVADYLAARFPAREVSPALAGFVHRRTEGHPLFMTSLVNYLDEPDDAQRGGPGWLLTRAQSEAGLEAPDSVRRLLRRKLSALDEQDRAALDWASVAGREFLSTVLARVLDVDELQLEERLQRLDRALRLIDTLGEEELPDGALSTRYRFSHSLYQEVLYGDIVSKRRQMMHQNLAERLLECYGGQRSRIAAPLALHFERCRDYASAIACLEQAGDNAAAMHAYGEACSHLSRALQHVARLPPAEQGRTAADLALRRGAAELALGRFDLAQADYAQVLERARATGALDDECRALSGLASALFFSHRVEEMAVRAEQALQAAARAGSEPLRLLASLLVSQVLQEQGALEDCKAVLDGLLQDARAAGLAELSMAGLANRGCVHYWQSEFAQAEERLSAALALARELRDGRLIMICLQFLGLARGAQGRVAEALKTLGEGLEMGRRNEERFWTPRLASHLGWLHRELHDLERAIEHDKEGLRLAREHQVLPAEASALLNLCLDYTRAARLDEAFELLHQVESVHSGARWFGWLYDIRLLAARAELLLARGDRGGARAAAERLLAAAGDCGAATYAVSARTFLAEVQLAAGELQAAKDHLTAALDSLRQRPAPLAEWRALASLGRLESRRGDPAAALAAFSRAAAVVRSIASQTGDERLSETFLGASAVREWLPAASGTGIAAEHSR